MGRRKIEIKAIKDDRNRSVTFLKRKGGLFKKAHELSVLCSVDVAVIIFGNNKKLYEYSSSDIGEILQRYNFVSQYGGPNEHKGPADFSGKGGDDDDDEDMGSPPLSHHSQEHPMMPPQFSNQAPFQHIRHQTPSASPPIPNGVPFHHAQRQHTPQPQVISRPNSRSGRRTSSSLAQVALPHGAQPVANGQYAYMPNPPIYQPPHGPAIPGHPQQQSAAYPYPGPQAHPLPHQLQQVYLEERRTSIPPTFPQQERHASHPASTPPQPQHQQIPPPPQQQPQIITQPQPPPQQQQHPQHQQQQHDLQQAQHQQQHQQQQQPQVPQQQMLEPVKRMSVNKSRSIFTPIDEGRSILSQHWASSTSGAESVKIEPATSNRSQSVDVGAVSRKNDGQSPPPVPTRANTHNKNRNTSMSSMESFAPPSRTNSGRIGSTRPRLALQIPDEPSDGGSQTADSSPRDTGTDATGSHPSRRGGTEGSHSSGVVLPPPSPSERSILSAGASGPPNPFARPHPPSQNSQSNAIDTPVSALPSRFMSNDFLPSPSSFYPDWNFGRSSDSNTLPSPLNFATPIIPSGPSFLRDDNGATNQKRKTPDAEELGDSKRVKLNEV